MSESVQEAKKRTLFNLISGIILSVIVLVTLAFAVGFVVHVTYLAFCDGWQLCGFIFRR